MFNIAVLLQMGDASGFITIFVFFYSSLRYRRYC